MLRSVALFMLALLLLLRWCGCPVEGPDRTVTYGCDGCCATAMITVPAVPTDSDFNCAVESEPAWLAAVAAAPAAVSTLAPQFLISCDIVNETSWPAGLSLLARAPPLPPRPLAPLPLRI